MAELAASVGLRPSRFQQLFRACTGCSVTAHLLQCRLTAAKELLTGSREPVLHIALRCGFPSLSHFYAVFARDTGQSPAAWRRARR
ncbi:MAG: helix-turn-helix transcriptional regulator [Planctomycetota bacterium]